MAVFTKGNFQKYLAGEEIEFVFNTLSTEWYYKFLQDVFRQYMKPFRKRVICETPAEIDVSSIQFGPFTSTGPVKVTGTLNQLVFEEAPGAVELYLEVLQRKE